MANRFSLAADIQPTVDQGAAEREGQQLAETFEDELGDLGVGADGGGVGGLGGARGGGGGGGATGAAAAGGVLGRGAMGAAAGGLAKVTLAGAVGFGLLKGIQTLAGAAPALKQTNALFGDAMDLFFRPFGNALSNVLRPFASAALDMAKNFNDAYSSDGLGIALLSLGGDVVTELAGAFSNAVGELITGDADLSDLITIGAPLAAAKLISTSSGSLLGASSLVSTAASSRLAASSLVSTSSGSLIAASSLIAAGGIAALAVDQAIVSNMDLDKQATKSVMEPVRDSTEVERDGTAGPGGEDIPTDPPDPLTADEIMTNPRTPLLDLTPSQLESARGDDTQDSPREIFRQTLREKGVDPSQVNEQVMSSIDFQDPQFEPRTFARELARELESRDTSNQTDEQQLSELQRMRRTLENVVGLPDAPEGENGQQYNPF